MSPSASPSAARSSHALIAADLASGKIDAGTALTYRAWALYFDPRLPERYWGNGAMVVDPGLHFEIEAALQGVPADQRAELERYLVRPTDPRSPFGPAPLQSASIASVRAIAADDLGSQCISPNAWLSKDWLAGDSPDLGVRAWICAPTQAAADVDLDVVLQAVDDLWPNMTVAEPNGMGLPISDATAPGNNGEGGLLDIYMLDFGQCGPRGGPCIRDPAPDPLSDRGYAWPAQPCRVVGFPVTGCSGYIEIARTWLDHPEFRAVVGHEFFHILQHAHNATFGANWYAEASAVWAGWHYTRTEFEPHAGLLFDEWQLHNHSLLEYAYGAVDEPQYEAWVWPLFQDVEHGPSNVFQAWSAAEGADTADKFNKAINQQLPFADRFRDFAVRNLNPREYIAANEPQGGLEKDRWTASADPDVQWFAAGAPHAIHSTGAIALGKSNHDLTALPLQSQIDTFTITGATVRQITIDLGTLANSTNADLDVVGRIARPEGAASTDPTQWRRDRSDRGKAVFCRDDNRDNFDLLYVVVSNHAFEQNQDTSGVKGSYTIEAKDKCDFPDGYEVTFSGFDFGVGDQYGDAWSGTASYDFVPFDDEELACSISEPDALQYCYQLTGGRFTWNYRGGPALTGSLTPGTDPGQIELFIRSPLAKYTRTYSGNLVAGCNVHVLPGRPFHDACEEVVGWLVMAGPNPLSSDWVLSGTHASGDASRGQKWTWTATPRFDE